MSYKAIYAYPWDLAEEGVASVAEQFRGLGLDTVTVAGSYHAGKFLRPHGKRGKVYFPQDGTVYFRPTASRYGAIKPVGNSMLGEVDVIDELTHVEGIATNVWLVLLHNTRLGMAHPEATVRNAFGDRYIYNLCPSASEARAYAVGLAADVTHGYAVSGVSLETPGFMPFAHGYHHEFAMLRQNRWLTSQLGLCFCEHCLRGAKSAGIEAARLSAQIAGEVNAYLDSDVEFPDDMAEAFWMADTRSDGELKAFLDWRCGVVTSLLAEIRAAVRPGATVAVIPSVARPTAGAWYEGSDLKAVVATAGILEVCLYERGVERIRSDIFDIKRRLKGAGRIRGILRPGHPDLDSKDALVAATSALAAEGIDEVAFYNYGHLRAANIRWIEDALMAMKHMAMKD
ncbi:hypothetical protein SAMN05519104_6293 [Rhizobiales bacterium GAS188]|nr:hypothetical protein SAMN05519104_6293 [Rhizobiales bacterium GAS188]